MNEGAPPPLHELETEIMELVWASGEVTVHDIRDRLNEHSDKHRAYTTVMTVMSRLCTKGLLRKERRGRSDHYVAALTRAEYTDARIEMQVQTLVAKYGDLALAHFAAHVAKLDPSRRRKLRRLSGRD